MIRTELIKFIFMIFVLSTYCLSVRLITSYALGFRTREEIKQIALAGIVYNPISNFLILLLASNGLIFPLSFFVIIYECRMTEQLLAQLMCNKDRIFSSINYLPYVLAVVAMVILCPLSEINPLYLFYII